MLVLGRKVGEKLVLGGNIVVTILDVCGKKARIGIDAPADVSVHHEEIHNASRLTVGLSSKPRKDR